MTGLAVQLRQRGTVRRDGAVLINTWPGWEP